MDPQLKMFLYGGFFVFAIVISLIMFPRLSQQVAEINATETVRPASGTPSPIATR